MARYIRNAWDIIVMTSILCGLVQVGFSAQQPDSCAVLAALSFPDTTITGATRVEAGSFSPPSGRRGASEPFKELGAFCRVTTATRIPPSSEAKSEIWLPIGGSNRELQPAGGGFYGGALPYARGCEILRLGRATGVGWESKAAARVALAHPRN